MSELTSFIITAGRTLAQMSLYTIDHPTVKGMIQDSHRQLSAVLSEQPEITFSVHENNLIVNGRLPENVPAGASKPFIQLMERYDLHSITFLPGTTREEMIPFFNLLSASELKKMDRDIASYLVEKEITHIRVNQAKYAKIGEDETIGKPETKDENSESNIMDELGSLSLHDLITKLIEKAIPNPKDRSKVFNRALDLVQKSIDETVKKLTAEFNKERTVLTNERERTEQVVSSMTDGMVVVDENGNVLMMNPAAEEIYGVKLGECVGKPLWEGLREEQMISLAKDLSIPTDAPITKEVNVRGVEETRKTLKASSAAVQDTSGRTVGMVSVLSDVSRHRELVRMQNEFMANVTHDLRTPIHALKLAVEAILEGSAGPTTPEQSKMLSLATRNVERLSRLIDDLLDFSQIESGSMKLNQQVIEIEPLLQDAFQSLGAWSKSRNINLEYEASPGLLSVYADPDRVLQVVNNLISNAIKFTPAGGTVTLRVSNTKDFGRQMVMIEVEDSGQGISNEDQKRIFERFVQLKNKEKLDIRGTGLGLGICRALVELHKGKLSLISPVPNKGGGSLFSFTLPAVQKSSASDIKSIVESTMAHEPKPGRKGFWKKFLSRFKVVLVATLLLPGLSSARPHHDVVRRVIEGDIIQLRDGTQVRYLGINAPDRGSDYFQESIAANRRMVENKEVRLEYGLQERDSSGMYQAYVFCDGYFINEEMVRQGMALVAPLANEEEHLAELIKAERQAHRKKRGLWRQTSIDPFPVRSRKKSSLRRPSPAATPAPVSTPSSPNLSEPLDESDSSDDGSAE